MIEIVKRASEAAGNTAKLARELGLTRQAVRQWSRVPAEHVLNVERVTGIHRSELRPDIYPPETAA